MELDASQLYADRSWVQMGAELSVQQRKALLQASKSYAESLHIEGLTCQLEKTSGGGLFHWGANKALVFGSPLGPYEYFAVLTLNGFGKACVVSSYKLILGESFFSVGQSTEVRYRVLVEKLRDVETLDYFRVVEKTVDLVADHLRASLIAVTESSED